MKICVLAPENNLTLRYNFNAMSLKFNNLNYPVVVIVGGGFGGLELAKKLENKPYKVYLIDKNNYHTFQPLLYQVATGGLGSDSIAYPLRKIIGPMNNIAFRMANVQQIDAPNNTLKTDTGDFKYDYLVLATGSTTNYFGNEKLAQFTVGLKSIPNSLDMRSLILQEFERSLNAMDNRVEQQRLLNFVIVGGGPTGVELAGAIAEIKKDVMPNDYRELSPSLMNINIIEAAPRVLSAMSEQASNKAQKFLEKLGVKITLGTAVKDYDGHTLQLSNGTTMQADTVIWTAGVKGNAIPGLPTERNRIVVNEYNKVEGYDNIFAIGDIAMMKTKEYPNGHPMLAPAAMQQAWLLAKNLVNIAKKKPLKPFVYRDKGTMATVGRHKAVVDMGKIKFQGWLAWYVWMFVHLMLLVGFRNRIVVFVNWLWNYVTYQRAIRLIIRPYKRAVVASEN